MVETERVGPGPQQLAAVQVVEQQQVGLDPDPDSAAAEDLRGQDDVLAQRHAPGPVDGAFDFAAGIEIAAILPVRFPGRGAVTS